VIATPGHTRGHVVYRDATAGLLFSGDHVLPHITPSIGFEPAPVPLPLADFLASLRLMRSIPDTLLLPAHGPVAPSVHERVEEILAHHDTRLALTLDQATPGPVSAYDVARRLGWTRRLRLLDDLDPMNQMLAILETKAHLDVLVVRGQAHYRDDGPVRLYSA
jgi:glyoxylase-like metal-dependent hydrolase (beta-lactamase superfamily II)